MEVLEALFARALRLESPWKITKIEFHEGKGPLLGPPIRDEEHQEEDRHGPARVWTHLCGTACPTDHANRDIDLGWSRCLLAAQLQPAR